MTEDIKTIFRNNKRLLAKLDRAIYYFRSEEYERALSIVADTTQEIRSMTDAVLENRDYFQLVSTDSVLEMLEGILAAKKSRDYILLADLMELQMTNFLCSVQELIINKEDFCAFDEEIDRDNRTLMRQQFASALAGEGYPEQEKEEWERAGKAASKLLEKELQPERLLQEGYRVEFTACGEMTVGVKGREGHTLYLHTNHRVAQEAFLLAKKWIEPGKTRYLLYGFGMGYVARELLSLLPKEATLEVYESDMNLLRLACAFSDMRSWLGDERLRVIYDPECNCLSKRLQEFHPQDKVCIHYPSLCHLTDEESRQMLLDFLPWARTIEKC